MTTLKAITGLAIAAVALTASAANAQTLVDRYSFNDTGTTVLDSVGGQNGTLVGGATEASGSLVTNGTGASGTGLTTQGANLGTAYHLPTGAVTFEDFFTPAAAQQAFATTFSFANDTSHYTIGTVQRGTDGKPGVQDAPGNPQSTLQPGSFTSGVNMFTVTYDGTNATAYLNNSAGSFSAQAADTFVPSSLGVTSDNGIADASPFPDAGLNGTTQDFRIYSGAKTAAQIQADFKAGPDALPVPEASSSIGLGVLLALGGLAMVARKKSVKA